MNIWARSMKREELAQWAEVVASVAIIATLLVLVLEVRTSTQAIERQAALDSAASISTPFFGDPDIAKTAAAIRAVDGANEMHTKFMERYEITAEQAIKWDRHLGLVWLNFQASFEAFGPSPELRRQVASLLENPDIQIFWDYRYATFTDGFTEFIEEVKGELPASTSEDR